jgi:formamidopyrimidine-DNA glycosylase
MIMSIELTEAHILSAQMNKELTGNVIKSYELQNCTNLQKLGCVNKDVSAFERLVGGKIVSVVSRGNTIRLKLDNDQNLVLAPEYGGTILLTKSGSDVPKFHLKLALNEGTTLTVSLSGIGCIQAVADSDLEKNYLFRRDFSNILDPLEKTFTFERFMERLDQKKQNLKAALVGKTAVIVGVSNSAFQDIIYRAKIHPKHNTASLSAEEKKALYTAIVGLVEERLRLGGKDQCMDLYSHQGRYVPKMGSNHKDQNCPDCGTKIEKISHGGGQVYICPTCQEG